MKKLFTVTCSLLLLICTYVHASEVSTLKAERFIKAYPQFFVSYKDGSLITREGGSIPFDDGKTKDMGLLVRDEEAGDDAFDPEDSMYWNYPAGRPLPTAENPPRGDPGRIRPQAVFGYMYGSTKAERQKKMRTIPWVGMRGGKVRKVTVTTVNGVDKALERVAKEIASLPEDRKKALDGIALNTDGPYGYFDRPVRGFKGRLSGHAYGISVDINGDLAYFANAHKGATYRYRNNVPEFLVDIFEKNGFIWGGRWHSYDAMHFEYRPELLPGQSSLKDKAESSVNCSR